MITELQQGFASALRELRQRHGLSKAKIADKLYLDERTWAKYESGASAPSAPEFISYFSALGEDVLRSTLDAIYPDIYKGITCTEDTEAMRQAAAHFFLHVATDDMVRDFNYIAFGEHGSNIRPQLAEFVVLDHLPLDYRVAVVKNIVTFYNLAEARGEIVCQDTAPVNIDVLVDAIRSGLEAVGEGRNSYSTLIKPSSAKKY